MIRNTGLLRVAPLPHPLARLSVTIEAMGIAGLVPLEKSLGRRLAFEVAAVPVAGTR